MAVRKIATIQHFIGDSTDMKPVAAVGSTFIEQDTKDVFINYDGISWTKYKRNSDLNTNSDWKKEN